MKIAFTGAQGTGKTTLVNTFRASGNWDSFEYFDNITRKLAQQGYKINKEASDETQLRLVEMHRENLTKDKFFADRCIIDCYVYGTYQFRKGEISGKTEQVMQDALFEMVPKYDIIFYLTPEFGIVEDGVRSVDPQFQKDISVLFEEVVEEIRPLNANIIHLTGSVDDRMKQAYKVIGRKMNARKS